jgi:beta-lactam-binding protein with PASTA domain
VDSSVTDPSAANNGLTATVKVEQRVPLVCAVPSLKGLTKSVAKRLLAATNCKLGKATKKAAAKGKTGTVIKQSKKAGSKLKAGSKVNVTLKK